MKFVSETVIDQIIEHLDDASEEEYESRMTAFAEAQPVLTAWLFGEQFDLLTEYEKGYLQYLCLIAWSAAEKVGGPLEPVSEEQIGEAEERNYEILENSTGKRFRDRLDPFFEGTDQEDLLAFAEDAVSEDEDDDDPESSITKEGREPVFVAVKTLIDVLTQ